ncbi:hypothetical protein BGZ99_004567 [Dissophora globulifera]|uniref:DUF3020 domain-containing protein n=1 Tax=Dissophora globulifera TaxID=979702 RepID=A0A9P6RK25_9FUNG|nr:hypothetical protein BGZ99_004567 [Dissophora globulifera]
MIRDDSAFQPHDLMTGVTATTNAAADPLLHETLKREALNEKVRTENRERKKRWREHNEDRNKDNDLRCRVNKRANKLFGKLESEHKTRWIEEEFGKRQFKRKDKERRRNPHLAVASEPATDAPTSSLSLEEQIALHQKAQGGSQAHGQTQHAQIHMPQQQQQHSHQHQQQHQHAQFDPTTYRTALALNDLVKKNGTHLDLAELTGVLTDPNLVRLIEIEANNALHPPSTTTSSSAVSSSSSSSATSPSSGPVMMLPLRHEHDLKATTHLLEADYPMDAVLTLMQLNGSWKA